MLVLCVGIAVAVSDQVTKMIVRETLRLGEQVPLVPGFFSFSHVHNTGAAWGMLQGLNTWLVVLSAVMLAVIVIFRRHFITDTTLHKVTMGLMIGGIAGNLMDRLRLGYVVDFLDFHWQGHHFPAFNIADSAICIGVGLYLASQFFDRSKASSSAEANAVGCEHHEGA